MRKIIFILLLSVSSIFSQDPNWNSFITFTSYPSPYFSDWQRNPDIGTLTVIYTGQTPVKFYFEVLIEIDGYGEAIKAKTATKEYFGSTTETISFSDLSFENTEISDELKKLILQSGILPESEYNVCVKTVSLNGDLLTEACTNFEIAFPNPPQLLSPDNEDRVEIAQPTFMWNPISVPADVLVHYKLKIVEVLENQTPYRAIKSNVPVLEKEIILENIYTYQLDDFHLEENHTYAWQVQATNDEEAPLSTNDGFSEIWTFTYGNPKSKIGIDTLTLIENFAYLIDINQLNITDNQTFLNLDGSCRLLIKSPLGVDKFVDVFAQNLMLQKEDTYESPVFLGGNILGSLFENVLGKNITGNFFVPKEIEFVPPNSLTISGDFKFGDNVSVPLNGKLEYTPGGLSGVLSVVADNTNPVFSIGDDALKMNVTSLTINYPAIEATLEGNLTIFGQPSACTLSNVSLNKNGEYSANIACNTPQSIPLLEGSNLFILKVNSVSGSISGNLTTSATDFTVTLNGGLLFNLDPNNSFGADVVFELKPNKFQLISFTPSANLSASALDLGWVKWNFKNINLKNLLYQNKKWDFDLAMDIDMSFPNFGDKKLPTIPNVSFTPKGFKFPKIDFDNFSIPNIDFAGFALDLYGISVPAFTFDLSKWNPGSIAKMAFDWKMKFNMPNLPAGTDDSFKLPNLDLKANITDGIFNVNLPELKFPNGVSFPLKGVDIFKITSLGGKLSTSYDGSIMSLLPDVKINGEITLPEALRCSGYDGKITFSNIKLNGDGTFSGAIENFIPKCPINVGLASLYMKKSKIELKNKNGQKIILSGQAGVKFNNKQGKEIGNITVAYDVLNGKLIEANGEIKERFNWDLPFEKPVFAFDVDGAVLQQGKLIIDGRSKLNLPGNSQMGVTFDKFTININTYEITDGKIIFDQPFAMKAALSQNGDIDFGIVKRGEIPKEDNYLYFETPPKISFDKNGLAFIGESKADISFGGKKLGDLSAKFSKDFAFSLKPFKVASGKCDIYYKKDKIGYFNSTGFYPDPNYFLNKVVPEKFPLPLEEIAYLKLKENGTLLVNVSTEKNSTRITTKTGHPIELVFPVLQFNDPNPPKILVNFSIAIDDATGKITDGFIKGTIPAESAATFDLSRVGIPYAIKSVYYGNIDGVDKFKLTGNVKAFDTELGCDSLSLNITQAGVLEGHADCSFAKTIQLMPNSDKLNLVINKVTGDFNVNLKSANYNFDLQLDSDLNFKISNTESFNLWTKLGLNNNGVRLIDSRMDSDLIPKIDLSQFKLGLENLHLGKLTYSKTPNANGITGWDFELAMDLDLDFTGLNFKIPKIPNVTLNRTGFHTMSEISIPSFPDSLKFQFSGIELKPLAFRMSKLNFNWFNPVGSMSDWGFKFDFEVNFPNLADATGAMKNPRLTIRDAGFSNGVITGNISPVTFDEHDNLNLNFGNSFGFLVRTITGGLFDDNGSQGIGFKFKGDFKLPEFMRCNGQSQSVSMGNAEFSLNSLGQVSGSVQNFVPTCPVNLGFGKFNVTSSSLNFSVAGSKQSAVLDMTGNLVVNTGNNNTVTANGALKLNLLTGEIIDGQIGINQQFVWGIPSDKPVLNFTINSAVLNKDGLKIDGTSSLKLPNNQTQTATFNNLVFDYRKMKVKSGNLTINGGFALKLAMNNGGIDWSVIPSDQALTEDKTAKIGFTSSLTLDSTGISVTGDAVASIRWDNNPSHQFGDIKITYSNDFKFSINPFQVAEGHADLIYNNNVIATLSHDGLTLGNIFGIIPMPEIIPLPDASIAYLRIKKGNQLLVQSETVNAGLRIYTTQTNPVSLLLPALKYGNAAVDSIPTVFDVVINPSSGAIVSGEITLAKADSSSLINLKDRGIPVDIYKIHYGSKNGTYALTASANISIPNILNGLPLKVRNLGFNNNGLTGNINLGEYSETYKTNITTVAKTSLGNEADITLEGLEVAFGASNVVRFSGKLIPKMLINGSDTTKMQYASTWNNTDKKFIFSFDFANGEKFDFGIGSFKPISINAKPAMKLTLTEDNFELLMNGEFKAHDLGDDFAITIEGLKITKNSVSADDISRPASNPLRFKLFNSDFKIYDQSLQNKAIKFSYNNGVLKLTLNGELKIFDHTTSFTDFTIGTDGTLSIGNANFIAGNDLVIIQNYLALTNLGIVSEVQNNKTKYKLAVGGWIKLPEPVASSNSKFDFGFNIAPDGTITANEKLGNKIIFVNEQQQIGHGDNTEFQLWKAKFDLTYLALNLNFNNIGSSSVQMVADIYWEDNINKRISIGDKSNVNNIKPGLEIDFNGKVEWKNASVHGNFEFNSDMLKIGVSNIQVYTDPNSKNLTIGLNGHLGLNFNSVSGGLSLANFRFNKSGIVNIGYITEGSLSIDGVGSLKLKNIQYQDSQTQIWVKGGDMPEGNNTANADSTQITVNSYLSFGGEVTITGLGSGGVDRFLSYSTNNSYTLLIRNANFNVVGTMKASMDLLYYSSGNDFLIRAGGSAEIQGMNVVVVGKIAKINNKVSFGFFLATSTRIDITPVVITGIGGGFFWNPTANDISTVKRLAGVDSKTENKIAVQGGKFAVFLYGQVAIASDYLISGKVLITVTDNQFMLDGKVILLNQKNRIEGGMHLLIQWSPQFAAEGFIEIDVKIPYVVKGNGRMGFYVYSAQQWAIYGKSEFKLFNFLNSGSDFFIGNSGFMLGMNSGFDFDIWIIEISAGIEVKVWYMPHKSWGAYAEAYVKAEILWGVVKAKGWLKCALIHTDHSILYGQAGLEIHTFLKDWSGSVWAKIDNGHLSGGRGSDSDMDALIEEAAKQSEEAEQQMNDMKNSIENRPPVGASFSEEQLKTAFAKLTEYGRKYKYGTPAEKAEAEKVFKELFDVEKGNINGEDLSAFPLWTAAVINKPLTLVGPEIKLYRWVIDEVYKGIHAPSLRSFEEKRQELENAMHEYEMAKTDLLPQFNNALNSLSTVPGNLNQTAQDPTSGTQFASYTYDSNGNYVLTTKPSMNLDEDIANANQNNLNNGINSIQEYRKRVYEEYQKLQANVTTLNKVLRGTGKNSGKGGAEKLSKSYAKLLEKISKTYLQEYIYNKSLYTWANKKNYELVNHSAGTFPASVEAILRGKANFAYVKYNESIANLVLAGLNIIRVEEIAKLSGLDQGTIVSKKNQEANFFTTLFGQKSGRQLKNAIIARSIEVGKTLWETIPSGGLKALRDSTKNRIAARIAEEKQNLEAMGNIQKELTLKMDTLYSTLSALTETEYDILTNLIKWEKEPPLLRRDQHQKKTRKAHFLNIKKALEAKMTVPIINKLIAYNIDFGIAAYVRVSWDVTSPRREQTTYMIKYRSHNPDINMDMGYQAVGTLKGIDLVYLPKINQTKFGKTNFYLKARNEIGYTIHRNFEFEPKTSNTQTPILGSTTTTEAPPDNTPPRITFVTYPYKGSHLFTLATPLSDGAKNYVVYYTNDSTRIKAKWGAIDPESGIQEFRYKLFKTEFPSSNNNKFQIGTSNLSSISTPGTQGVAQNVVTNPYLSWPNNYGRKNVVINGLNMQDGEIYQVRVAAKNGDGLWKLNTEMPPTGWGLFAGKYIYVKVDLTPPPPPTKVFTNVLPMQQMTYYNSNVSVRGEVELPEGAEDTRRNMKRNISDVDMAYYNPAYVMGGGNANNSNYTNNFSFAHSYTPSVATYAQFLQFYDNSNAEVNINYSTEIDDITGQPYQTEVRIVHSKNDTISTHWISYSSGNISHIDNTMLGNDAILTYLDSFYVEVRSKDLAGNRSPVLEFKVRPYDTTPPTQPVVNFAYSSNKKRAYLVFDTRSMDPECGILYYEVGLGSNTNNITYDDSIRIKPSDISGVQTVLLPVLPKRNRTVFAVRAVNGQGTRGESCYTGYFYQDDTPPERPTVSNLRAYESGNKVKFLAFDIDNLKDDESGVESYQYRIRKQILSVNGGNKTTNNNVGALSNISSQNAVSLIWTTIKDWQQNIPSQTHKFLRLSQLGCNSGDVIKIEVKAKNRLGMWSYIGEATYEIPDFSPPSKPGIVITSENTAQTGKTSAVGNRNNNRYPRQTRGRSVNAKVKIRFTNLNDPQSGISQIRYRIFRAPKVIGVGRKHYSLIVNWTNQTASTVEFPYSKYDLSKDQTIMVEVKVQNGAGLWSPVETKYHVLK